MESSSHKNEFSLINTPNPDNNKTKQIHNNQIPQHSQSIITLNKNEYYQNENIIGFIKLTHYEDKPISNIQIKLIQIHSWISPNYKIKHKQTHVLHKQLIDILPFIPQSSIIKSDNNNLTLSRGEYIFPFNFNIPPQALPSFEFNDPIHNMTIYIRAYLQIYSQKDKDNNNSIPVTIHSIKPSLINKTPSTVSLNTSVFKLGLFKKGGVNITINADDNKYLNGSEALLKVEIENKCGSDIKEIKVTLNRQIILKENKKEHIITVTVNSIKKDILCKHKDKITIDVIMLIIDDDCFIDDDYKHIFLEKEDVININYVMPTVKANGFECKYFITVSAISDAWFKGNIPNCTLPINVIY